MSDSRTVPEWLRKIILDWQMPHERVASILGVTGTALAELLASSRADSGGTIPSGFDAAPALIRIYQLLERKHPKNEDQVKWLFTAANDFGDTPPIDVMASSRENLFWVAYYLETSSAK